MVASPQRPLLFHPAQSLYRQTRAMQTARALPAADEVAVAASLFQLTIAGCMNLRLSPRQHILSSGVMGLRCYSRFVFLKHHEAEASEQGDAPRLSKALSHWRRQAAIAECGLVDSPLKKSGQARRGRPHKVGRSSLQEARNPRIDTSGGNSQLAAGGRIAHFPSWRKGNSHSASDRTGEIGMGWYHRMLLILTHWG